MPKLLLILSLLPLASVILSISPPKDSAIGPYLNGQFPAQIPGEVGSWEVEDAYPDLIIASPLRILPFTGTDDVLILNKIGEVWKVNWETGQKELVLDITDRTFSLGESGSVGIALHPEFGNPNAPDKQLLFVFYRFSPNPHEWAEHGYNRLSKFPWNENEGTFDPEQEEVLFQQFDQCTWHNGGGMFFKPDGFLYLSLGDEGKEEHQVLSNQRLDGGLFSGILRIDIDNDPARSHPIRRQPQAIGTPPSGWPETFSQGYFIPNDNPWLSEDGDVLEEFYAIGIRSPYSTYYDEVDDKIWLLDVGSDVREEFNHVEKGDNLQWPYMEGFVPSEDHERPEVIIGNEKVPFFEYSRATGNAVIAGGIYRGDVFPSLYGKYLFADFTKNKLMALELDKADGESDIITLIPNLQNLDIELPEKPGITGVHLLEDGNILITVLGLTFTDPGKIFKLRQNVLTPDPVRFLSELNVFTDLDELTVKEGIVPFTVNAPLWSDGAGKKRWMVVPEGEQIRFNHNGNWGFPEGTVFIKHFDLPLTTDPEGPSTKLETRFFVMGAEGIAYGLTYQWNEDQTDAELLKIGGSQEFEITDNSSSFHLQKWDFPSRTQCVSCHNKNAGFVLGVKTHQLNGPFEYDGITQNQLKYLSDQGILNQAINHPENYSKAYPLEDNTVDLELRLRSYWDANCASCHRKNGIAEVDMDLRFEYPLFLHNTIGEATQSQASDPARQIIEIGSHQDSEFWIRDSSTGEEKMPPLARNTVDQMYIDSLAKWIDQLPGDVLENYSFSLFPNPSRGYIYVRFSDEWPTPIDINIFNTSGKLIQHHLSDDRLTYLELNDFPPGVYFLEGSTNNGSVHKSKFVLFP